MGTGSSQYNLLNDFWAYDQIKNAWVEKASFPGPARWGGVGFAIGDKGYIGLGMDAYGNRLNDFYEYSLITNQWRRIADFGGTARLSAISFTIGAKGYVGLGDDLHNAKDLWAYDPDTDSWQKMTTYTGPVRVGAVAIVIGTLAYIGTGSNQGENLNDWWAYDPISDLWLRKHDLTTDQSYLKGRDGVGFAINGKGYVCLSNNTDKSVWEYDPVTDLWSTRGVFEGSYRANSFGFSLGTKGYITMGGTPSGSLYNDLFEFDPSIPQDIP
ncbi:galactose oxidase [Spirosoma sp. HMF4905]|uniref:Galactose oxidase n=1 Tax=Spirosoma arboris TaxID=2682092 RepID=A0A7K1SLE7_9BACT|nr:kelch repeat-containing protein [Spirosoma arboris]MVM34588.1 galactose oxidase [Spirosoma arboris]